jgi:hypothetical protein
MVYPLVKYVGPAHPEEPTALVGTRELDARITDGIDVRLLWHPESDRLSVAVKDTKTGEAFELPIDRGESALDVFHHPFAYAARRDHGTGKRRITFTDIGISA